MKRNRVKAIFFDLDNTIYAVESITEDLFKDFYLLIKEDGAFTGKFESIKMDLQRKPFQVVAAQYDFSENLFAKCEKYLSNLTYNGKVTPFKDYILTKEIDVLKFLITTGFTKLQQSKVKAMDLAGDFKEIFIVDPMLSKLTKKEVFERIIKLYNLHAKDILVVGDDINSEIKAAQELGIQSVLYDYTGKYHDSKEHHVISNYRELKKYL